MLLIFFFKLGTKASYFFLFITKVSALEVVIYSSVLFRESSSAWCLAHQFINYTDDDPEQRQKQPICALICSMSS